MILYFNENRFIILARCIIHYRKASYKNLSDDCSAKLKKLFFRFENCNQKRNWNVISTEFTCYGHLHLYSVPSLLHTRTHSRTHTHILYPFLLQTYILTHAFYLSPSLLHTHTYTHFLNLTLSC